MKRANPKKIALCAAVTGIAALVTGCGSAGSGGGVGAPPPATGGGVAGYGTGYGAGCIPITQPSIGFTANGLYMDSINVAAGMIPMIDHFHAGQQIGQVMVTGAGAGGPYQAPNSQLTITPDGSISMNILTPGMGGMPGYTGGVPGQTGYSTGGYGYGTYNNATGTGIITVSSIKQQMIMSAYGSVMMTYPGAYPTVGMPGYNPASPYGSYSAQPCISGVAISLSHNNYNLYGGKVYLYLNMPNNLNYGASMISPMGSGHGVYLQF